jgi:hypothetical protein
VRSREQFTTVSSIRRSAPARMGTASRLAPSIRITEGPPRGIRRAPSKDTAARARSVTAVRRRSIGLMSSGPSRAEAYVSGETSSDESRGKAGGTYTNSSRQATAATAQRQACHPLSRRSPIAQTTSRTAATRERARR